MTKQKLIILNLGKYLLFQSFIHKKYNADIKIEFAHKLQPHYMLYNWYLFIYKHCPLYLTSIPVTQSALLSTVETYDLMLCVFCVENHFS